MAPTKRWRKSISTLMFLQNRSVRRSAFGVWRSALNARCEGELASWQEYDALATPSGRLRDGRYLGLERWAFLSCHSMANRPFAGTPTRRTPDAKRRTQSAE